MHLSHIGHSLVGDFVYGGKIRYPKKASENLKNELFNFRRQALHSKKITLSHPRSGDLLSWKVPLPEDMLKLLSILAEFDSL